MSTNAARRPGGPAARLERREQLVGHGLGAWLGRRTEPGMECDRAREATSARIDGEEPGVPPGAADAHLPAAPPAGTGGSSRVSIASDAPLPPAAVSAALDEAGGYRAGR